MLMQLSAVGEQLGSAQEAPVRTQELQAPNAKLLPSEHELHETAAQLKAAELDITSQQQLLSTLLRSVSEGVVIVDCNGHVLMENEAAIRIVGYSARLVGAKRWCEAIGAYLVDGDRPLPPEDMPTMRACRGEEVRGVELVLHVIRLESSQGLLLQIWDDGVGIARARERAHEGFGLRIMRYRSRLISATLKVVRGANGGTVVTCTRTRPGQGACLVATPTVADANGLTAKRRSEPSASAATTATRDLVSRASGALVLSALGLQAGILE